MLRAAFPVLTCFALIFQIGCGSSAPLGKDVPSDPVALVVYEFLEAVRCGDTDSASVRLTPLALKRTSELDLNFSPPGSPTAKFSIGRVEMIESDKAVVESTWSDLDADGQPNVEKITWALKLTDAEWRISGMAAEIGPDLPPVVMDFENPGQIASTTKSTTQPTGTPLQASQPRQDPFRTVPK